MKLWLLWSMIFKTAWIRVPQLPSLMFGSKLNSLLPSRWELCFASQCLVQTETEMPLMGSCIWTLGPKKVLSEEVTNPYEVEACWMKNITRGELGRCIALPSSCFLSASCAVQRKMWSVRFLLLLLCHGFLWNQAKQILSSFRCFLPWYFITAMVK